MFRLLIQVASMIAAISTCIAFYGNPCVCPFFNRMAEMVGHHSLSQESVFLIGFTKLSLLLMICNYFAYKVAKRFLIENLFVILSNYLLLKALEYNFDKIACAFMFCVVLLTGATLVRPVKMHLFTALCAVNFFIFAILTMPKLEMMVIFVQHKLLK